MRELYAFAGRRRIGTFRELRGPDTVVFTYASTAGPTPVSLSLPRDGSGSDTAAAAWLDNLLPARPDVRRRWARERGLPGADPFTLLTSYGDDLPGAVSLSADPDLPWRMAPHPVEATGHDIATRVAALRNQPTSWLDQRARPRFSLGGTSGKFTLRRAGGRWLWPTYEHPSTHVVRPIARAEAEAALETLADARAHGVPAARAEVATFGSQTALLVERWDRLEGRRIHAETLRQALGRPSGHRVSTAEATDLLTRLGLGEAWERLRVRLVEDDVGSQAILLAGERAALAPMTAIRSFRGRTDVAVSMGGST